MSARADRLIGVFGKREMELAAIRIIDRGVDRTVSKADFEFECGNADVMTREGFRMLVDQGWLVPIRDGICTTFKATPEFKARIATVAS